MFEYSGNFNTTCPFSVYKESDNGFLEISGEVDGTCHWERRTWDHPGCHEIDIDYGSIAVWGDVGWQDDKGEIHSLTIRFYGRDADVFLSGWSIDVANECDFSDWSDPYDEDRDHYEPDGD
jgi:hypothetical protein